MRLEFEKIIGAENVRENEPMHQHTTFKIGGCADYFLTPENAEQLALTVKKLNEIGMPYFVLGNGSNVLIGDKGFRGAVICMLKKAEGIALDGECITAQSGALLSRVANVAARAGLSGLEFASGIPGSIGGGVYMNAGAYGLELSEVIESVKCIDNSGNIISIGKADCDFGYRQSIFMKKGFIVCDCKVKLRRGSEADIRALMNDYTERRVSKQPLDKPSAGSTFKRPEGHFAGALIEKAGLKGCSIGGAAVSEKHAGFVINRGGATASDVLSLIRHIQCEVEKKFGVMLEPEVKMVGEF